MVVGGACVRAGVCVCVWQVFNIFSNYYFAHEFNVLCPLTNWSKNGKIGSRSPVRSPHRPDSKCNSNIVCWRQRRQRRRWIYGAQRQARKKNVFPLDWLSQAMIYVTVYHSPSCVISNIRTKIAQWIMCHIQRVVRALIPCEQSQRTQHAESNRFAIENNWTLALSRACMYIHFCVARCSCHAMWKPFFKSNSNKD